MIRAHLIPHRTHSGSHILGPLRGSLENRYSSRAAPISPRPFPTAPTGFFRNRIRQRMPMPAKGRTSKRIPTCPFRRNSDIFGRWAGKAAGVLCIGTTVIELLIRGERSILEESPAVSKIVSLTEAGRVSLSSPPRRWGGEIDGAGPNGINSKIQLPKRSFP